MEGIISGKAVAIQKEFVAAGGCNLSLENWAKVFVIKLLEATHGQWLYRNVVVHDICSWRARSCKKEARTAK